MRILLCEDESRTRSRMAKAIRRHRGVDEVLEAEDGQQALEMVRESAPDAIITDICMPRMTGLELIGSIRESGTDIEIVIMSGYNDFEYARQAIRYGVGEYLLKPVDPAELEQMLDKLYSKIEENRYHESNVRNPFFNRLLSGSEASAKELLGEMEVLKLPRDSNLYILSFMISGVDGEENPDALLGAAQTAADALDDSCMSAYPFSSPFFPAILFMFRNGTETKAKASVEAFAADFAARLDKVSLMLACSSPKTSLNAIAAAKDEALLTARLEMDFDRRCRFYDEDARKPQQDAQRIPLEEISRLVDVEMLEDRKAIEDELGIFISELGRQASASFASAMDSLHLLTLRLGERIAQDAETDECEKLQKMLDDLKASNSLWEISSRLKKLLFAMKDMYVRKDLSPSDIICRSVKARIEENVSNGFFSVQDAIAGLNYSENYIRYIFSNHFGMSIKEYTIKTRMEKAKDLLLKGMQIKKIAELTGYENQRYFASCFKDYTGMTPTEWRENMTSRK